MSNSTQQISLDSPIGTPLPPYEDIIKTSSGNPNDMLLLNISKDETVYQHYIIIHGQVLEVKGKDDKVVVHHPKLPSLEYPAIDGYFKAVVELSYGANELKFEYKQGATVISQRALTINRSKFADKPPLKLAILLAKDSPETFDAPPDAQGPGLNDLDAAVKKMRCCAYMWQAYMAEMMYRNGCGRRTFRLEEEPDCDNQDGSMQQPRAKVHIIRSQTSLSEMRDKRNSQQWRPSEEEKGEHSPGAMMQFFRDSVDADNVLERKDNIACLLMDSHWDAEQELILAHAAYSNYLKGPNCIFGSHTVYAWPSSASEIAKCFLDTTETDTQYISNENGVCPTKWKSAAFGQASFLHMAAITMHSSSWALDKKVGIYTSYSRAFMVKEPGNDTAIKMSDELAPWRPLEYTRFAFNHLLALPGDAHFIAYKDNQPKFQFEKNDKGVVIKNPSGITAIEFTIGLKPYGYVEYTNENYSKRVSGEIPANADEKSVIYPTSVFLSFKRLHEILKDSEDIKRTRLNVSSYAGNTVAVMEVLNNQCNCESCIEIFKQAKDTSTEEKSTKLPKINIVY